LEGDVIRIFLGYIELWVVDIQVYKWREIPRKR
jgi:hypothetical protein